jgi:hypothetical protein
VRLYGLVWLALAACFAAAAIGVLLRSSWWLAWLEIMSVVSIILCLLSWPDTRLGILANVLVLGLAFLAIRFEPSGLAIRDESLETLWTSVMPPTDAAPDPETVLGLPPLARLYLTHALGPQPRPASAVRLRMHGEIKLGNWRPFQAEQVISRDGFVWAAIVSMYGLPIRGSDSLVGGAGSMRWKLLDIIPVMTGAGPDITRSAIGRLQGELAAWLPSVLQGDGGSWSAGASAGPRLHMEIFGEPAEIQLETDAKGSLKTLTMRRWGNPDGGEARYIDFGVIAEEERRFGGFTVPSRIRAGWYFGTDRFDSEGEFFRASILRSRIN